MTPHLKTTAHLITSHRVLSDAILNPQIRDLNVIKELKDRVNDLRKMMEVKPVEDTFLIKVALGLPDGGQAALIVDAVVDAYFALSQ